MNRVTYSSDDPIRSKREDRFNRAPFATRVADTTATRADPSSIVIGLYGPWGGGKSSTLNLMEEALSAHSNVLVVRFNPWLFDSEDRLVRGFFDTLAATLSRSLATKAEKIGGLLRDYGTLLSLASFSSAAVNLADYGTQIGNVRSALDWAFSPSGDASIGVALTAAAVPLWCQLSLIEECRSRAEQALSHVAPGSNRDTGSFQAREVVGQLRKYELRTVVRR